MDDEELRGRLARFDPAPPHVPMPDRGAASVAGVLETIMTIDEPTTTESASSRRARRWAVPFGLAGAIAAAIAVVAVVVISRDDDSPPTERALSLPSGLVMQSCVPFDARTLSAMETAFAGTVTEATTSDVVLEVDRWFRANGEAIDSVRLLQGEATTSASLDGVEFVVGERYLVTATQGTVNGCGFTVVATPELERVFEQAFGS